MRIQLEHYEVAWQTKRDVEAFLRQVLYLDMADPNRSVFDTSIRSLDERLTKLITEAAPANAIKSEPVIALYSDKWINYFRKLGPMIQSRHFYPVIYDCLRHAKAGLKFLHQRALDANIPDELALAITSGRPILCRSECCQLYQLTTAPTNVDRISELCDRVAKIEDAIVALHHSLDTDALRPAAKRHKRLDTE
eukprot:Lankesteria_metandrocarpae@DN6712_c0_g1_i1.p1